MTENDFWIWFKDNQTKLETFIKSDLTDYTIYNLLSEKVAAYNSELFPEITIDKDNNYVLILTSDGIRAGIPFIEKLADAAPPIPNWVIQKYRSAGGPSDFEFSGLHYKDKDIKIKHSINNNKVDLQVYIKGYQKKDNRYAALAFLYLDHTIGEYNVMTKIGTVDFEKLGLFTKTNDMINLSELKNIVDKLSLSDNN